MQATRRSGQRYRHDCTEADHVELLELLKGLPCQVMVSGHPSTLYDDLLRDWRRIVVQVTTRVRTEVVWVDFEPGRMHSAGDAGRNRTDPSTHQTQGRPLGGGVPEDAAGRTPIEARTGHRQRVGGKRRGLIQTVMNVGVSAHPAP